MGPGCVGCAGDCKDFGFYPRWDVRLQEGDEHRGDIIWLSFANDSSNCCGENRIEYS